MKEQGFTIQEESLSFPWDDNFSELTLEDFAMIQKNLPYGICHSIGMALTKLKMIEEGKLEEHNKTIREKE